MGSTISVTYGNHTWQGYDCLGTKSTRNAINWPVQLDNFLIVHIWLYFSITLKHHVESFSCTICQQAARHKSVIPYDSCYEILHTRSILVGCPTEAKLWLVSKTISKGRANNFVLMPFRLEAISRTTIQNLHTQNRCVLKNNNNFFYWETIN